MLYACATFFLISLSFSRTLFTQQIFMFVSGKKVRMPPLGKNRKNRESKEALESSVGKRCSE